MQKIKANWLPILALVAIAVMAIVAEYAHHEDLTARNCRIVVKSSGSTLPDYVCEWPSKQ